MYLDAERTKAVAYLRGKRSICAVLARRSISNGRSGPGQQEHAIGEVGDDVYILKERTIST